MADHVEVPVADGVADAYRAGSGPSVLFVMDAIGLRPQIGAMVDRIAARGYTVLAPNVFHRAGRAPVLPLPDFGDPDERAGFMDSVRPLIRSLDGETTARDVAAYLAALPEGPVAVTGYCMGARFALRAAAAAPDRVVAVGGFHGGGFVTEEPDSPHLAVDGVRAEVYLGHAADDASNPAEQIEALDRALDAAGVSHVTEVYDAPHGYTMADTAAYDEAAAERHFEALFALLERAYAA